MTSVPSTSLPLFSKPVFFILTTLVMSFCQSFAAELSPIDQFIQLDRTASRVNFMWYLVYAVYLTITALSTVVLSGSATTGTNAWVLPLVSSLMIILVCVFARLLDFQCPTPKSWYSFLFAPIIHIFILLGLALADPFEQSSTLAAFVLSYAGLLSTHTLFSLDSMDAEIERKRTYASITLGRTCQVYRYTTLSWILNINYPKDIITPEQIRGLRDQGFIQTETTPFV